MFTKQYKGTDVRKALQTYDRVQSFRKASRMTGISKSTIHRWVCRFYTLFRSPKTRTKRPPRKRKFPNLLRDIQALFHEHENAMFSLHQIQTMLSYCTHKPSLSWIHHVLRLSRISRRRFQNIRLQGNSPLEDRIKRFQEAFSSTPLDSILCLDEVGFSNCGNALYGYYPKGKKPTWQNTPTRQRVSCCMAITTTGVLHYQVQPKAFNTSTFKLFIQDLLPKISASIQVIVMDNIAFHKAKAATVS
jgi:hypothetical protein